MTLIFMLIFIVVAVLLILIFSFGMNLTKSMNDFRVSTQNELMSLKSHLHDNLMNNSKLMQSSHSEVSNRLDNAARVVADVREKLGRLEESAKNIHEVGKDISSLQELLRSPKIRGGLGEYFLGDILSQIMPKDFFLLQHEFKTKDKVDAVIKVGGKLVPIDSKFPLENFRKFVDAKDENQKKSLKRSFVSDVKGHIKSISEKYILTDEETYDFALMYIPAENVYYESIINDKDDEGLALFQYSLEKKVIPVSPNSLYAYLQVIILGLKGMQVEKSAEAIINSILRLKNDLRRFNEDFLKIGKHLKDSKTSFDNAEKHFEKILDKLIAIEAPQGQAAHLVEEGSEEKLLK